MSVGKSIVAAVAALSMTASPAFAAGSVGAVAPVQQQVSPWLALAAMSGGSGAIAACGAAVVAQGQGCVLGNLEPVRTVPQTTINQPIPVPPSDVAVGGLFANPLLLALGAVALAGIIYAVIKASDNKSNSPT